MSILHYKPYFLTIILMISLLIFPGQDVKVYPVVYNSKTERIIPAPDSRSKNYYIGEDK